MNILTEHWLSLGVGICLMSMVLYGHYRGFLKMAVSMLALVVSLVAVPVIIPYLTGIVKENTGLHQAIGKGVLNIAGKDLDKNQSFPEIQRQEDGSFLLSPSQQRELIENLKLPDQMKTSLLEHNNSEIYHVLGVDGFLDYLGTYLAHMVLNLVSGIILFLIIFIGIRILIRWLDLIARLPILHGMNQIAGAVLGGVQGLLLIWFLGFIVQLCSHMNWAQIVLHQIYKSEWLLFLYEKNIFHWLFAIILNALSMG